MYQHPIARGVKSRDTTERPAEEVRMEPDFDARRCPAARRILFADRYAFNLGTAKLDKLQYSLSLKKDLFNK